MNAIMISIQPEFVEKILKGEKTIEIRKSFPKCELPCKVFVYCTKGNHEHYTPPLSDTNYEHAFGYVMNGKVVAEFILNKVSTYDYDIDFENDKQKMYYIRSGELDKTCLTYEQLLSYGQGKTLYGWQIDDLKVYNEPKDIRQFKRQCSCYEPMTYETIGCMEGGCVIHELGECDGRCIYLDRPPQSWCYVEDIEEKE